MKSLAYVPHEEGHPRDLVGDARGVMWRLARRRARFARLRRWIRSAACVLARGGHELYRARSDNWIGQECLLCGHRTHGWTIDRRDRRLSLVNHRGRE